MAACGSGKWQLYCSEDGLTDKVKIHGSSPRAETIRKPGAPYDNLDTKLYINIFPNGSLNVAIWASSINLVGGTYHGGERIYKLNGKFSPFDKLETYSVRNLQETINVLWFTLDRRTYSLILNNDSLLLELPYYTGKGRYRYSWDKEDLANQIRELKKTCFAK